MCPILISFSQGVPLDHLTDKLIPEAQNRKEGTLSPKCDGKREIECSYSILKLAFRGT